MKKVLLAGLMLICSIFYIQEHVKAETNYEPNQSVDEVVEQLKEVLNQYLDEARAAPGSED